MTQVRQQRSYNVVYYQRHRAQEIARVRSRQEATRDLLRDIRRVACSDCGRNFAPHQMDFDHRDPLLKAFGLTTSRAMLVSRNDLLAEVAKCDVVCANCHRLRTWRGHREGRVGSSGSSKYLDRKRAGWRAHARLLDELRDGPCADCGGRFPPCAMDFDHRDSATKTKGVTRLVGRAGASRIIAEAAKCDIVCANCHRARTYDRRMADRLPSGRSSVG